MLKDKWEKQIPTFAPPTKEQIESLKEQAKWDKRVKRILPKLIERYENEVKKNGRVSQSQK